MKPSNAWAYPLVLVVVAIVIIILYPNGDWGDTPTVADLVVSVLVLAGLIVFEVREARDFILKKLDKDE